LTTINRGSRAAFRWAGPPPLVCRRHRRPPVRPQPGEPGPIRRTTPRTQSWRRPAKSAGESAPSLKASSRAPSATGIPANARFLPLIAPSRWPERSIKLVTDGIPRQPAAWPNWPAPQQRWHLRNAPWRRCRSSVTAMKVFEPSARFRRSRRLSRLSRDPRAMLSAPSLSLAAPSVKKTVHGPRYTGHMVVASRRRCLHRSVHGFGHWRAVPARLCGACRVSGRCRMIAVLLREMGLG
jgi:hypothetical protein